MPNCRDRAKNQIGQNYKNFQQVKIKRFFCLFLACLKPYFRQKNCFKLATNVQCDKGFFLTPQDM